VVSDSAILFIFPIPNSEFCPLPSILCPLLSALSPFPHSPFRCFFNFSHSTFDVGRSMLDVRLFIPLSQSPQLQSSPSPILILFRTPHSHFRLPYPPHLLSQIVKIRLLYAVYMLFWGYCRAIDCIKFSFIHEI